MNIIEEYNTSKQKIYDHVGFVEDWVVCPLDDCTRYVWKVFGNDFVRFADTTEDFLNEEEGKYYEDEIYTQRFYSKWVYRGSEFTMIFCDPHTDGVKWRLFDNKKEIK